MKSVEFERLKNMTSENYTQHMYLQAEMKNPSQLSNVLRNNYSKKRLTWNAVERFRWILKCVSNEWKK